jgi:hypothetical protein
MIHLVSFGNESYYNALERLLHESNPFPISNVCLYKDTDLVKYKDFWERHQDFILTNKRGYGYWIWKPYIVLYTLSQLKEGDILWYVDAGCSLIPTGMKRFLEYIDIVKTNESGILSFQMSYLTKAWTKMDVLNLFDSSLYNTGQLTACTFFLRKCENTVRLVNEWYELCCQYHLVNDEPSILPNDDTFQEHRHDQSIFSLLRYTYGTSIIPRNLLKYGPEGEVTYSSFNNDSNPIHSNRCK